jgi:hypothetical protein
MLVKIEVGQIWVSDGNSKNRYTIADIRKNTNGMAPLDGIGKSGSIFCYINADGTADLYGWHLADPNECQHDCCKKP